MEQPSSSHPAAGDSLSGLRPAPLLEPSATGEGELPVRPVFEKQQMDAMVNRFLQWKLPEDFAPDCGISFKKTHSDNGPFGPQRNEPVGTNLLSATQAREMLVYVLNPSFIPDWSLLQATQNSLREHMAEVRKLRAALAKSGISQQ